MESLLEREQRINQLEEARARRHADTVWPTPDDSGFGSTPIEVAPGRGNLTSTSGWWPNIPTALQMIGPRTVSFARLFMSQPWVAAAVMRQLTWAVRVPLKCYERLDGDNARRELAPNEHPLAAAIASPWEMGTQAQFVQACFGPVMVHGNSTIEIDNGSADSIQFTPKDWRFTRPIMPFRDTIAGWTFDVDSPEYQHEVPADLVLHNCWWSPVAPIGCSPLQQLGITLQIEDAAQRYQRSIFANGGRSFSAIMASEEFLTLDPDERKTIMDNLRGDITRLYVGPENAGRPALLPPGLTWESIGQTSVEAELIDQRKVARDEVCAVYLLPPAMLGIMDKANYSNMESQKEMTYTDTLGPPLIMIEQGVNARICNNLLREPEVFVEFDFSEVLRGDRLAEIDAIRDAVGNALFTPNEGRAVLKRPQSDNPAMDEFYGPLVNTWAPMGQEPAVNSPEPAPEPTDPAAQQQQAKNGRRRLYVSEYGRGITEKVV